jgi:preprotein translocase subunit YajC
MKNHSHTRARVALLAQVAILSFSLIQPSFAQDAGNVSAPNVVAPAQPAQAAQTGQTGPATSAGQPAVQQAPGGLFGSPIIMMVVMLGVMYFLMIRPQQKRMKKQQELHKGLQSGDEVVTNAGIIGTITGITDKVVTLEISRNVQMKVLRSQVNQVVKGTISDLQT